MPYRSRNIQAQPFGQMERIPCAACGALATLLVLALWAAIQNGAPAPLAASLAAAVATLGIATFTVMQRPARQLQKVVAARPAAPQAPKVAYSKESFGGPSPSKDARRQQRQEDKDRENEPGAENDRSPASAPAGSNAAHRRLDHINNDEQSPLEAMEMEFRRQAAAERISSIATLASGLGHDIGNIVLPILCRLDSLAALPLPDRAIHEIRAMRESVMHLRRLSGGLAMLGLDPQDPAVSAVLTVMQQWWPEVQPLFVRALPKSAELVVEIPNDLPALILPPHQLTQTMLHLVTNAAEAMDRPGQVRLAAGAGPNATVRLRVQDEGRGMSEALRRQAVDPFFTTKKRGLSTGLGLAMVNSIVNAAGGSIEIESLPGRGTTVLLTLPASLSQREEGDVGSTREARVLVSDPRLAAYARAVLQGAGFSTLGAAEDPSPREALWIIDASEDSLQQAREFLSQRPQRRVMVLGPAAAADPGEPGFIIVNGSHRAMQRAMQRALLETAPVLHHA